MAPAMPTYSYADTSSTSTFQTEGLSTESQKKIQQEINRLRVEEQSKTLGVQQLDEYAEFGKKYGAAITESAKALGQTVNDFLNTPAGKWALIFIAWKVFGQEVYGLITSMIWFMVMLPLFVLASKKLVFESRQKWMDAMESGNISSSNVNDLGANYTVWSVVMVVAFLFVCFTGFSLM